ncbi:MAG: DoxX family protein [Actinobacteria bacterium]|nr:DoxX family protein [Actinomycetota bacterium]
MTIVLVILASLLGAVATASALGKLTKKPDIMASMEHVGVTPDMIQVLALLEIFGAIGLLAGIRSQPLGVAAAIGLTLYFDGAVFFHLRVKDKVKDFAPAMVLGLLSLAVAILEITAR